MKVFCDGEVCAWALHLLEKCVRFSEALEPGFAARLISLPFFAFSFEMRGAALSYFAGLPLPVNVQLCPYVWLAAGI